MSYLTLLQTLPFPFHGLFLQWVLFEHLNFRVLLWWNGANDIVFILWMLKGLGYAILGNFSTDQMVMGIN